MPVGGERLTGMGERICNASGKIAYVRHQEAEKIVAKHRRLHGGADHPQSMYRCVYCHRWHLTTMTPAQSAAYVEWRGSPAPEQIKRRSFKKLWRSTR